MGRPRKTPADRLSRYVQARVSDPQWDWLEERAAENHDGDLSKALRECIDWSRLAVEIFSASDPHAKLDEIQARSEAEADRFEFTMDEEPDDDEA